MYSFIVLLYKVNKKKHIVTVDSGVNFNQSKLLNI